MEKEVLEILLEIKHFPYKLKKKQGETLKKYFFKDGNFKRKPLNGKSIKDLEFRYIYLEDGVKYVLLEEYLFKEGEAFLSLENSIGVGYYLNKI